MIPPHDSLVKYDNPILVSTTKEKGKKKKNALPPVERQSTQTEDILNSILPPREWTEDGQLWVQYVSSTPATRLDVINLQEQLDQRLTTRQARETGICPVREELYALVYANKIPLAQADAVMAASNRPMYCLQAMSMTLRKADLDYMQASRIDSTISTLVDLTGANERIFKSPIPLVYTRLTARFLTVLLVLLPLALWGQLGESWNHWAVIPAEFIISFFLFGIEEVGIQIEEPFSVLPLEAFCNGAIAATSQIGRASCRERV